MGNTSMAGLSDMSMGDIRQVTNDSMADCSMASLGDDQMASIDESGAKYTARQPEQTSKAVESNMLDGLKTELGLNEVGNP